MKEHLGLAIDKFMHSQFLVSVTFGFLPNKFHKEWR